MPSDAVDAWYEEDERVHGHPRDPFSRIDVRVTSRPVRIELDGQVLAETTRARMLFETGIHTRFYVPKEDVRGELTPTTRRSYCPYKGEASYWSLGEHAEANANVTTPAFRFQPLKNSRTVKLQWLALVRSFSGQGIAAC